MTISTESAMTSRETSEKCMPSWPIEMPSETEIGAELQRVPAAGVHALLRGLREPVEASGCTG